MNEKYGTEFDEAAKRSIIALEIVSVLEKCRNGQFMEHGVS